MEATVSPSYINNTAQGTNVSLCCNVTCPDVANVHKVVVKWKKIGLPKAELGRSSSPIVRTDTNSCFISATHTLSSVKLQDKGQYYCEADFDKPLYSADINLTVYGKYLVS